MWRNVCLSKPVQVVEAFSESGSRRSIGVLARLTTDQQRTGNDVIIILVLVVAVVIVVVVVWHAVLELSGAERINLVRVRLPNLIVKLTHQIRPIIFLGSR